MATDEGVHRLQSLTGVSIQPPTDRHKRALTADCPVPAYGLAGVATIGLPSIAAAPGGIPWTRPISASNVARSDRPMASFASCLSETAWLPSR